VPSLFLEADYNYGGEISVKQCHWTFCGGSCEDGYSEVRTIKNWDDDATALTQETMIEDRFCAGNGKLSISLSSSQV
jgi:hypothetical protein